MPISKIHSSFQFSSKKDALWCYPRPRFQKQKILCAANTHLWELTPISSRLPSRHTVCLLSFTKKPYHYVKCVLNFSTGGLMAEPKVHTGRTFQSADIKRIEATLMRNWPFSSRELMVVKGNYTWGLLSYWWQQSTKTRRLGFPLFLWKKEE